MTTTQHTKPLFPHGSIVATPGALESLLAAGVNGAHLLRRHLCGDWGDLDAADKRSNDLALTKAASKCGGLRILSAYKLPRTGVKVWVITEADRSATTLLLPEEY